MGAGQIPVQHHHVVTVDPDLGEDIVAIQNDVDCHAFSA
jgi:hypothetical protein